jgi:hypothetical protein
MVFYNRSIKEMIGDVAYRIFGVVSGHRYRWFVERNKVVIGSKIGYKNLQEVAKRFPGAAQVERSLEHFISVSKDFDHEQMISPDIVQCESPGVIRWNMVNSCSNNKENGSEQVSAHQRT